MARKMSQWYAFKGEYNDVSPYNYWIEKIGGRDFKAYPPKDPDHISIWLVTLCEFYFG